MHGNIFTDATQEYMIAVSMPLGSHHNEVCIFFFGSRYDAMPNVPMLDEVLQAGIAATEDPGYGSEILLIVFE